jgi:hypothetical protein
MNRESKLETRSWKLRIRKRLIVSVTKRRALLSSLAALILTIAACSHPQGDFTPVHLSTDLEPLRADFNRDAGQIRLVLLVDPT